MTTIRGSYKTKGKKYTRKNEEWMSEWSWMIIIVIIILIAPYSPKEGIGLVTIKVWTLTNKNTKQHLPYPYTINKKTHSSYYNGELRISFLFGNI